MRIVARLIVASCVVLTAMGCSSRTSTPEVHSGSTGTDAHSQDETVVNQKKLAGEIEIANLPSHFGLTVSLAFFPVSAPDAPAPYDGDPPGDVVIDCEELYNEVDLDTEVEQPVRTIPFSVKRPAGSYYLQLRTLLYRKQDEKVFAQAEQFFFGRRPLTLLDDLTSVTLPVEWPSIPLDELGHYGTIEPRKGR